MENEGERKNNFVVSFSALRKDIVNVLDFMERLMNEEDQNAVDMDDQTEKLKFVLAFICTYVQLSHCDLEEFEDIMSAARQEVENLLQPIFDDVDNNVRCKYNMDHVLPSLMDNIGDCISSCYRSTSSVTMTDEHLNFLLQYIHYLSKCLAEQIYPFETQYEILQKVMQICYTSLKASTSAEVGCFIKNLLEISPDILREYLIHLQEHMVNVITTPGARNIHVMIEFLLIVLTDMPKDFIHHDKLFDLLARVGELTMKVSTLIRDLEEKSRNEESIDETSRATLDLLEKIELLKEDLKHVYLKVPDSCQWCLPMSDGSSLHASAAQTPNDLLDSNAYSIALIKEEIGLVKEDLEFIRSFFGNVEQGLYKDLWACVLDVAYEAKDVIDSIIVRDNGLLHLIFSLPISIKKIRLIREEVSNLLEKIPKNRSRLLVNSPKNPVERKSLMGGKIIVGFKEETNWLIRKLISGPKDLDVISITVCSHFDIRAWCTVNQEYDEKKLLVILFNQVTGSDLKSSEGIDVADKLRKQLYGKRYLIVLDDVWDTATWDDLTRPFPEVEKGSRIILTTRQKEVAFHGKCNTDPLNLRLLSPEESWELLEKRAFGEQSCSDELLDVGKEIAENCKGLPLVADLIAGVIAGRKKTKSVIELSYDHLPLQLKPFFLHLASYPKDTAVDRDILKTYWRAEGLVEQTEMKSVEEVMEIYLDNLISSSLVIAFNKIGRRPTCQLHDLVHDFCLIKATEEKLFGTISSSDPSSPSDLVPRIVTIDYDEESFGHNNFVLFSSIKKRHCDKHLYSLTIAGHDMVDSLCDACHIRDLRLLRVLHLHPSFMIVKDSFLNEIGILNHLRIRETRAFLFKRNRGYFQKQYWFPKLDFLTELEFLKVDFESSKANDIENNHPEGKKEEWNMGEEEAFENLKYLELDEVTLANWEVGEESFPMIEKLLLLRCRKLTEIPPNFGDIGSLKIIQLVESPQLEDSALEIKQYVEDITGEDRLQILGPNNIPLSKTDPENLKGREGEVTLVE
ncbi:hypothetical protein P3L10_019634 [Capsicum annuum]